MALDGKVPAGRLEDKWANHKFNLKLVNPANKRRYEIIVIGSGLAGASAAASLAELGYKVRCFCVHDSPRRAHDDCIGRIATRGPHGDDLVDRHAVARSIEQTSAAWAGWVTVCTVGVIHAVGHCDRVGGIGILYDIYCALDAVGGTHPA